MHVHAQKFIGHLLIVAARHMEDDLRILALVETCHNIQHSTFSVRSTLSQASTTVEDDVGSTASEFSSTSRRGGTHCWLLHSGGSSSKE